MKPAATYFDHIILGGGIVGLAIAANLAIQNNNKSILLFERRPSLLQETSSHNSGVIHAGLYYPKDSLKTKLCIEGNKWIWKNLQNNNNNNYDKNFNAKKCGKWIIASCQEEVAKLQNLQQALEDRGMPWRWVSKQERLLKEPELECIECLESQDTGIVDVHSLANYYESIAFSSSGNDENVLLKNTEPIEYRIATTTTTTTTKPGRTVLQLTLNDEQNSVVETGCVINSTGLFASVVAQKIREAASKESHNNNRDLHQLPPHMQQKLVRGSYVSLSGKQLLSRLVYPCPLENLAGLGVHSVIDLAGDDGNSQQQQQQQLLFGPNVEFLSDDVQEKLLNHDSSSRYQLPPSAMNEEFLDGVHRAVSKYLPRLNREKLHPAFCGIRPKLSGKGEGFRDFFLELDRDVSAATNGEVKVVNCLGIESPGLTASFAIGRYVVDEVLKKK